MLVKGRGGEPDVDLFFTHFAYKYFGAFFYVGNRMNGQCSFMSKSGEGKLEW